jgi:hypothetical protein
MLEALYHLNPVEEEKSKFDVLEEYPRKGLTDYEKIKDEHPANVLTATWEMEEKDETAIQDKFGISPIRGKIVSVTKGYDNRLYWTANVDEEIILEYCLDQLGAVSGEIIEGTKVRTLTDLLSQLENIKTPTGEQSRVLSYIRKNIPTGKLSESVNNLLTDLLPKFLYFSDYHKMAGRVALGQLNQRLSSKQLDFSDKIFLALMNLAGTKPDEIQSLTTLEHLIARLEGVSNKLTDEIFEYWSQNEYLRVNFLFESARPADPPPFNTGYIFITRIENTRHQVSVSFENRSSGFVWFFSFLVWLSQVERNYGNNLFILLDEPGLSLHAKAQADLLRYINKKLKPNFQVMYTAHSPFMVDPDNIFGVRTVEDVIENKHVLGTKVGDKVLSTDFDTLFPLQAALGYEITQTLFVGKHTLLVEGPSDLLYLKWFSQELKSAGRVCLDRRWVISPSGGIDKISSFITLFGGNKLHVAVFTDFHAGDKKKIRSLRESEILREGHVFSADYYAGKDEADIEDVIGRDAYIYLVNECYKLDNGKKLPEDNPSQVSKRVIAEVEEHFGTLSPDAPEFDHYLPAIYLTENSSALKKKIRNLAEALGRFEKLFSDINSLLSLPDS